MIEFMYDLSKRKEFRDFTCVGDIINELSKYPQDSRVVIDGDSYFYLHVEKDNSILNFDSASLDEEYEEVDECVD